ncbi:unnamed protein product [Protopolystoma xenopodis]|uniref:Uncharacterized protein n=1 Tax=Protopolystoma xenopodis TaxID=117903 RepID=A0A448X5M4_9PLAT|nr:unnamed protein product [Protopolystoma xenopodis]
MAEAAGALEAGVSFARPPRGAARRPTEGPPWGPIARGPATLPPTPLTPFPPPPPPML